MCYITQEQVNSSYEEAWQYLTIISEILKFYCKFYGPSLKKKIKSNSGGNLT
jgi:hypothetical protein